MAKTVGLKARCRCFSLVVLPVLFMSSQYAFAVSSHKYPNQNLALTCGDVDIVTSNYTTKVNGKLDNGEMDLGQSVRAISGNATVELVKTSGASRTLLGKKKGFGFFDGGFIELDLRNTQDNDIYLVNKLTGKKALCVVHGDCCK